MSDYRDLLNQKYEMMKAANRRYSLRSFARYLEISITSLSIIMRKERHLSVNNFLKIADKLNFDQDYIKKVSRELSTLNVSKRTKNMELGTQIKTFDFDLLGKECLALENKESAVKDFKNQIAQYLTLIEENKVLQISVKIKTTVRKN